MADIRLDDIRLFLCDPRVQVRSSLRMAMNDVGLRNANIWEGGELEAIPMAVSDPNGPDIIICDVTEQTETACEIFRRIRQNELGTNPFVCIIAVAWSPKQQLVNKVVNSGADLLVAAPISPSVILDRIDSLINNRKPFVVTNDYIGPDRRYQQDRESDIEQIDVPNTLRDRALGQYDANAVKAAIEATKESIDGQRIDRHTFHVSFVADEIFQLFESGNMGEIPKKLKELSSVTEKLRAKAEEYGNQEIEQLCFPLKSVVEQLIQSKGNVRPKDIELLGQLSLAFRACLQAGDQGAAIVADISKTVAAAGVA